MATSKTPVLPEVNFSDWGDIRYLHLGTEWVQGSTKSSQAIMRCTYSSCSSNTCSA